MFLVTDIWPDISRRSCLLTKRRYYIPNVLYSRPNEIMPSNCYSATGYVWERVDGLGSAPPHSRGWGHSRQVFFLRLQGKVSANCNVFFLAFLHRKLRNLKMYLTNISYRVLGQHKTVLENQNVPNLNSIKMKNNYHHSTILQATTSLRKLWANQPCGPTRIYGYTFLVLNFIYYTCFFLVL